MGRVTLQTVADAAGVSRSTVSNAYNRPDQLSADLRDRILRTATELGYAGPDAAARSLRSGRAGAIGVLFTETLSYALSDPYAVEFLRGLAAAAEEHSTGLLLVPLDHDEQVDSGTTRQALVDGFCMECVDEHSPIVDVILTRGLPLVSTTRPIDRDIPFVAIDERGAARTAAEHLVALGHQRVTLLVDGRPPLGVHGLLELDDAIDHAVDRTAGLRLLGYCDPLQRQGIDVVAARRNSHQAGLEAAALILDRADRPTAVLACSDVLALAVLEAMEQRGLTPGVDLSVVGFDDIPGAAAAGLTTVRQPAFEKGRCAGLLLLAPDEVPQRSLTLPTELVVRASTGPAPAGSAPARRRARSNRRDERGGR